MTKERQAPVGMTAGRIQALNDGVFAIAMTLLILNIELPRVDRNPGAIIDYFDGIWPQFFDFGLSFLLLAFLWTAQHRQFHWIKRVDERLLWIDIIFLLLIVLVPFSTSMYGEYRFLWPTALFMNLNLLLVFVTLSGLWLYATNHPELLSSDLSESHKAFTRRPAVLLVVPAMSFAAVILSVLVPAWSTLPYIPVLYVLTRKQKSPESSWE